MKKALILLTVIIILGFFTAKYIYINNMKKIIHMEDKNESDMKEKLAASNSGLIVENVFIDNINIGGLTKEQAEEKLKEYVENLKKKSIRLMIEENETSIFLEELGFNIVKNSCIENAYAIGRIGTSEQRYLAIMEAENTGIHYKQSFGISNIKLNEFVNVIHDKYSLEMKETSVIRVNGKFIYNDGVAGNTISKDSLIRTIQKTILKEWDRKEDIKMTVELLKVDPEYTIEDMKKVKDVLGSFTTTYEQSSTSRAQNLLNGANLLNNVIVYPGEKFSARDYLAPFTEENGYKEAKVYSAGKVVDSIGGGACQVVTTLYNALLKAEVEIIERHPHSMTVSYVDLSRDATITDNYKDLKFVNNTESPLLIEVYTKDKSITFKIWGNETRDKNRKIEFKNVIIEQIAPPLDVITLDSSKSTGYKEVTQNAKIGYKAELYKVIYQDDMRISEEKINESEYASTPRYITIGPKS